MLGWLGGGDGGGGVLMDGSVADIGDQYHPHPPSNLLLGVSSFFPHAYTQIVKNNADPVQYVKYG